MVVVRANDHEVDVADQRADRFAIGYLAPHCNLDRLHEHPQVVVGARTYPDRRHRPQRIGVAFVPDPGTNATPNDRLISWCRLRGR